MRRLLQIIRFLVVIAVVGLFAAVALIVVGEGPEGLGDALNAIVAFIQGDQQEASGPVTAPGLEEEAGARVFRIAQEESEVRFLIDEVLRGADFTVVGATDQVAGDLRVDKGDPAASEIGLIRINARTLTTDNGNRNRALRTFILKSAEDEFEYAEFETSEVTGMPESVTVGEPFDIQILGELRIAGATQALTFDATITLESEERLSGSARSSLQHADLGLTIPSVPFVSDVAEEVRLEIDFVALAVAEGEDQAPSSG
ncbi:MAG: YceI family protein [Anaerolineaceae bacterium]|nr:YceI family protein [Anaerolineaceae bacterium]